MLILLYVNLSSTFLINMKLTATTDGTESLQLAVDTKP
jgi:hypothetical protein